MAFHLSTKQLFSRKLKASSKIHVRRLIAPAREWLIGLLSSAILFVVLAGYVGYDFYIQYNQAGDQTVVEETSVTLRTREMSALITEYRNREQTFANIRSEAPIIVVPVVIPEGGESEEGAGGDETPVTEEE